jgi:hypothetical protein
MEFAISMYKGGERVYAKDCDFNSYSELALLCPDCKQEVYLRKGKIIKPYFAHFRATNPKQAKQCKLRVSSDEHAIETNEFIGYRGQRLEIFQQRFISMISVGEQKIVEDVKFKNWIDSIKRDNNQAINNITKDCTEYFINHHKEIVEIYCIPLKYDQPFLQQQIALKAIDYLCIQSSLQLLEYLLYYSIYKLYEHEQDKLFKQEILTIDIANICQYTAKVIMFNPWIEAVNNANDTHLLLNNYQILKSKIVKNQSLLKSHTDIEASSISGSEQGAIFWLKRVYLEWSEYYCLTDRQTQDLQKRLASGMSKLEHENAIARLKNSDKFKSFLTFKCPQQDSKVFVAFIESCNRLNLLITELDDPFDGKLYEISPNWDIHNSIRFSTVLRLIRFSINGKNINQEYLKNEYISMTEVLQLPCMIALDILSGSTVPTVDNQILTSAIKLNKVGVTPIVTIRNKATREVIEKTIYDGFRVLRSDRQAVNNSVSTRIIGKVSKTNAQSTGTYREPKDLDGWMLLSHRVTSTETAIVGMNSPKYRNCTLVFKRFELERDKYGVLTTPATLKNTLEGNKGIRPDNILGYVGIRYVDGSIEKLGILYLHNKRAKNTDNTRTQLWYTDIVKYHSQQTNKTVTKMITKYVRNPDTKLVERKEVAVTSLETVITSEKVSKASDISVFMSLYGIKHSCPVTIGKLCLVGDTEKNISINWHTLLGLKLVPMNKDGNINYNPKFNYPLTVV